MFLDNWSFNEIMFCFILGYCISQELSNYVSRETFFFKGTILKNCCDYKFVINQIHIVKGFTFLVNFVGFFTNCANLVTFHETIHLTNHI